uniref:Transcription initiation factor IIE subunit alpha n=1 Tax=Chromera velia CCMP2878 TaxID=1169474 RepID=A0A0G4FRU8_9ALVE|eukprot:Cvel_18445.t1-p1 / transcript=Cvel_18445.t1 / gene=Cvel_18445 / organism=Chromera_velia_CCMP2878 / gene_product=hypothetical protein / transcript_product=hypothetical protein / location=Cvel_scaffold1528:5569-10861(-) / protein_length=769 / sequence_SO=supercontig / SO=protein_coding / is_pseudo=false
MNWPKQNNVKAQIRAAEEAQKEAEKKHVQLRRASPAPSPGTAMIIPPEQQQEMFIRKSPMPSSSISGQAGGAGAPALIPMMRGGPTLGPRSAVPGAAGAPVTVPRSGTGGGVPALLVNGGAAAAASASAPKANGGNGAAAAASATGPTANGGTGANGGAAGGGGAGARPPVKESVKVVDYDPRVFSKIVQLAVRLFFGDPEIIVVDAIVKANSCLQESDLKDRTGLADKTISRAIERLRAVNLLECKLSARTEHKREAATMVAKQRHMHTAVAAAASHQWWWLEPYAITAICFRLKAMEAELNRRVRVLKSDLKKCTKCGKEFTLFEMAEVRVDEVENIARCPKCQGPLSNADHKEKREEAENERATFKAGVGELMRLCQENLGMVGQRPTRNIGGTPDETKTAREDYQKRRAYRQANPQAWQNEQRDKFNRSTLDEISTIQQGHGYEGKETVVVLVSSERELEKQKAAQAEERKRHEKRGENLHMFHEAFRGTNQPVGGDGEGGPSPFRSSSSQNPSQPAWGGVSSSSSSSTALKAPPPPFPAPHDAGTKQQQQQQAQQQKAQGQGPVPVAKAKPAKPAGLPSFKVKVADSVLKQRAMNRAEPDGVPAAKKVKPAPPPPAAEQQQAATAMEDVPAAAAAAASSEPPADLPAPQEHGQEPDELMEGNDDDWFLTAPKQDDKRAARASEVRAEVEQLKRELTAMGSVLFPDFDDELVSLEDALREEREDEIAEDHFEKFDAAKNAYKAKKAELEARFQELLSLDPTASLD